MCFFLYENKNSNINRKNIDLVDKNSLSPVVEESVLENTFSSISIGKY
jgi:hypothetical protein